MCSEKCFTCGTEHFMLILFQVLHMGMNDWILLAFLSALSLGPKYITFSDSYRFCYLYRCMRCASQSSYPGPPCLTALVCHRSTKSIIWRGLNERKTKSKFTNAGIKRIRLEKVCQLLSPHSSCWDHISWVGAGIEQQKESKSRSWNALFRSTRIACFADREGNIAVLDHMLDLAAHCFLSASDQF